MKLWEARYGFVMLTAAETREEAEEKVQAWMAENNTLYGQWLIREVKEEN